MFKERAMKLHSVSSAPPICFVNCSRKQIFMAGQFHVLRSILQVLQIVQSSLKSWISLFSKSFKSKPENHIFGFVLVACKCLMCFPLACKQFRWFSLFSISEAAMLSSAVNNVAIFPLIGHADKIHDIKGDVYPKIDQSNSYSMLFKIWKCFYKTPILQSIKTEV